ncbi:hypothetical protein BJ138DRAFT_976740, partial [Hygrophoropsis aurantiaca]
LTVLRTLLSELPDTLPLGDTFYQFRGYVPDPEKVEMYGSREAAFNQTLEVTFAPKGRSDGLCPFLLQERGPGLVAVVDILQDILNEFPESVLLHKWITDLQKAAT